MNICDMNIFQKMASITIELQTVAKNLTVATSKNASYKAVSERDILDAVKPLENKYGVYSYPVSRTVLESNLFESESEYSGKVTKKTTFMTRIATVYRFVNVDNPDEYIETTTFAEGIDAQDKGSGKAMTYGDKYALMKAYKISTGDDPDQTESEDNHYKNTGNAKKPQAQTEPVAELPGAVPYRKPQTLRQQLFAKLQEKGMDAEKWAQENGVNKSTPDAELIELLNELED